MVYKVKRPSETRRRGRSVTRRRPPTPVHRGSGTPSAAMAAMFGRAGGKKGAKDLEAAKTAEAAKPSTAKPPAKPSAGGKK